MPKRVFYETHFYDLHEVRCEVCRDLRERLDELNEAQVELRRLSDENTLQYRYAKSQDALEVITLMSRCIAHRTKRVQRQVRKYKLWLARIEWWVDLYDRALVRRDGYDLPF